MNTKLLLFRFILCLYISSALVITAFAHSGRTDAKGGHYDRSTGEYHYHHGYSAHDHYDIDKNGTIDCPYSYQETTECKPNNTTISYETTIAKETSYKVSPAVPITLFLCGGIALLVIVIVRFHK